MAFKAIAGGLLSGLGEGMMEQAAAKRKGALQAAKEARRQRERMQDRQWDMQDAEREREWNVEDREAEFGEKRGLLEREHELRRETAEHKADLDSRSGDAFDMSAGEKRVYDQAKERFTNPNTGQVDWNSLIRHLRNMPSERGGERWNEIADYLAGDVGATMTADEAREQAEREAEERAPGFVGRTTGALFGSDEDPWEGAGSKEAWIDQRAREIRSGGFGNSRPSGQRSGQPSGREAPRRSESGTARETDRGGREGEARSGRSGESRSGRESQIESGARANRPPGQGTRQDPYQATTQEQIDWFKANAESGAVIDIEGSLYTK